MHGDHSLHAEFEGPQCAYRVLDMGNALGLCGQMAMHHDVDNRIMYRIERTVARQLGMIDADYVMGISHSRQRARSIYFDR